MKTNKYARLMILLFLIIGLNAFLMLNNSNNSILSINEAYSQQSEHTDHDGRNDEDENEIDDDGHDDHVGHDEDEAGHEEHSGHDSDEFGDDDHAEHNDEDEHADHGEDEGQVEFTAELMDEFGIQLATAASGTLYNQIEVQGEIVTNPETIYHIVPRVSGVVRDVKKKLGEFVSKDDLLGIIESRELAILKSAFLVANERYDLTDINLKREEELWRKKISAEQDYLAAKQARAQSLIELHSAEQQLHAVGFSQSYVDDLPNQPDSLLTQFEFRAPINGQIIEKHFSLGEFIKEETPVLTIADLSSVWIYLTIYQKDLPQILVGQDVQISLPVGSQTIEGEISYISPIVDEHTRTAQALVVIDNTDGQWRPGLFVNGFVKLDEINVSVYVPKTAIQRIENDQVVFVKNPDGFGPQVIQIGMSDKNGVQVLSGLKPGQTYVSDGGFALKAEMDKEAFSDDGHAH